MLFVVSLFHFLFSILKEHLSSSLKHFTGRAFTLDNYIIIIIMIQWKVSIRLFITSFLYLLIDIDRNAKRVEVDVDFTGIHFVFVSLSLCHSVISSFVIAYLFILISLHNFLIWMTSIGFFFKRTMYQFKYVCNPLTECLTSEQLPMRHLCPTPWNLTYLFSVLL